MPVNLEFSAHLGPKKRSLIWWVWTTNKSYIGCLDCKQGRNCGVNFFATGTCVVQERVRNFGKMLVCQVWLLLSEINSEIDCSLIHVLDLKIHDMCEQTKLIQCHSVIISPNFFFFVRDDLIKKSISSNHYNACSTLTLLKLAYKWKKAFYPQKQLYVKRKYKCIATMFLVYVISACGGCFWGVLCTIHVKWSELNVKCKINICGEGLHNLKFTFQALCTRFVTLSKSHHTNVKKRSRYSWRAVEQEVGIFVLTHYTNTEGRKGSSCSWQLEFQFIMNAKTVWKVYNLVNQTETRNHCVWVTKKYCHPDFKQLLASQSSHTNFQMNYLHKEMSHYYSKLVYLLGWC